MSKIEAYTAKTVPVPDDLLILADSADLDGGGDFTTKKVTVESLRGYTDLSTFVFFEDFASGTTSAATIGSHGWTLTNGAAGASNGEADHPGIIQRGTSATINTLASLYARGSSGQGIYPLTGDFDFQWVFRLNTNDTDTLLRVGMMTNSGVNPPADGMYLEKLAADTNWFFVTRASNVQTRTATGVAVSTGWTKVRFRRIDASTIAASLNGGSETNITATLTTAQMQPATHIYNATAVNKTVDIDLFLLVMTGLSR